MRLYKLSLLAGGLAVVLAACATPAPDPTSVPAPIEEEAVEAEA